MCGPHFSFRQLEAADTASDEKRASGNRVALSDIASNDRTTRLFARLLRSMKFSAKE
jgi:hypothetical protein